MRAYIDASAAAKLIRTEAESDALADFLDVQSDVMGIVSSLLLETELRRVAVREHAPQTAVTEVLQRITLVEPERAHFHAAGILPDVGLRSLDALHLVTAMRAQSEVMVAYDRRLLDAAAAVGISTLSPS